MACVNPDGTLTGSALSMLKAIQEPSAPEQVAATTGLPLFRIRSGLREMSAAGMLREEDGKYRLTEMGRGKLGG
jgi:DNA-binding IclR family transcriptional regulator